MGGVLPPRVGGASGDHVSDTLFNGTSHSNHSSGNTVLSFCLSLFVFVCVYMCVSVSVCAECVFVSIRTRQKMPTLLLYLYHTLPIFYPTLPVYCSTFTYPALSDCVMLSFISKLLVNPCIRCLETSGCRVTIYMSNTVTDAMEF